MISTAKCNVMSGSKLRVESNGHTGEPECGKAYEKIVNTTVEVIVDENLGKSESPTMKKDFLTKLQYV